MLPVTPHIRGRAPRNPRKSCDSFDSFCESFAIVRRGEGGIKSNTCDSCDSFRFPYTWKTAGCGESSVRISRKNYRKLSNSLKTNNKTISPTISKLSQTIARSFQ